MGLFTDLLLIAGLCFHALASAAPVSLAALASEEAAVEALAQPNLDIASAAVGGDVEQLVHRGWHDAVRALVARSHATSQEVAQKVAAHVRHAVTAEKNRLDDLIRVLDKNYGKASDVNPAMQWAQNSTHVFIAVKFCKRWNAPGALEVENETVSFSACCFNFTAFGEHSFIRRRYHLSFELFRPIVAAASSWFLASAGRVTVLIAKGSPANWPRLFRGADSQPKNLGVWLDMRDKWKADLEKLPVEGSESKKSASAPTAEKKAGSKKQKKRKKTADQESEDDDALEREGDLLGECTESSYAKTSVAELCGKIFDKVAEKPAVAGRRWLIEFYSSAGDGDLEAMRDLTPKWKRLADVFPSMAPGGRVGAVDCSLDTELCKKLGAASKLPQIRRFTGTGLSDAWGGALDSSIETLAAWGSGKEEL